MTVTEGARVRGVVVACGTSPAGFAAAGNLPATTVPARPGKAEIDPLLGEHTHLIVSGTDADLAAVVLRLLRRERLTGVSVGYVPVSRDSAVAALWGLPADRDEAFKLAAHGDAVPAPLVRDDSGGVLVGRARFGAVRGEAYCDEHLAFRGAARSIEVTPGPAGLVAKVVTGGLLRRTSAFEGRAFQVGGTLGQPWLDGVEHPRPASRWTWYRHTEDLRLVRPA